MTTHRAIVIVLAVVLLSATQMPSVATSKRAPSAVGVGLREYSISVYRARVPAGRVVFNAKNFGEDAHDLQVLGPKGFRSAVSREVSPFGGRDRLAVMLKRPGGYTLICTLADHVALGMTAKLKVTKRKAKSKN